MANNKDTFLLRIDSETKEKLRKIAKRERRSMQGLVLHLIDIALKMEKE